jgi:hypothetical protein
MMPEQNCDNKHEPDNPVDDVRRIREALSARFGNDVRQLGEYARRIGEQKAAELGCPTVHKPAVSTRSADT